MKNQRNPGGTRSLELNPKKSARSPIHPLGTAGCDPPPKIKFKKKFFTFQKVQKNNSLIYLQVQSEGRVRACRVQSPSPAAGQVTLRQAGKRSRGPFTKKNFSKSGHLSADLICAAIRHHCPKARNRCTSRHVGPAWALLKPVISAAVLIRCPQARTACVSAAQAERAQKPEPSRCASPFPPPEKAGVHAAHSSPHVSSSDHPLSSPEV